MLEEMMMKKISLLVAFLAIVGFANAELISNGDFEAGLSGWSGWGSGSGSATWWAWYWWSGAPTTGAAPGGSDGGQYAVLDTTGMPGYTRGAWGWVWQGVWQPDLPMTPGQQLDITGMANGMADPDGSGYVVNLFLEWEDAAGNRVDYDGDGTIVNNDDRSLVSWTLTGGAWEAIDVLYNVPTQDLLGNPFANPIAQANVMWSVESASLQIGLDQLSIIPEPATMALLGLGLLMLRRKK